MSNENESGGPYTSHGHPIKGVTIVGSRRPPVARCGGPAICGMCARDAERIRREHSSVPCPTCSGPMRETVGMVCQTCGTDYGSTMAVALLDALLPLCDDLPGEPPALVAWAPEQLAKRIAEGLRGNGWVIRRG